MPRQIIIAAMAINPSKARLRLLGDVTQEQADSREMVSAIASVIHIMTLYQKRYQKQDNTETASRHRCTSYLFFLYKTSLNNKYEEVASICFHQLAKSEVDNCRRLLSQIHHIVDLSCVSRCLNAAPLNLQGTD